MVERTKIVVPELYVVQCSFAYGIEWEPWQDMPGDGDEDVYEAIGKAELFHYFMEHGTYPESYLRNPLVRVLLPTMQEIHKDVMVDQRQKKHKVRTRIVKRSITSRITDEEIDKAMLIKHGKQA